MIPQTFHVFPDKTTRDLVDYLAEAEHWTTKRNALYQILAVGYYDKLLKPRQATPLGTISRDVEKIYKETEEKIKRAKQCSLEMGCE
jgi:hypothetical protein